MKVSIFLPCYNESRILRQTIKHYRMCFSDPSFTIFDNYSTDNSVEIAKKLGCKVIYWSSKNLMSEHKLGYIRNNSWKKEKGWVIICDMDEWLMVTDEALQEEEENGTTILHVKGFDMVGESKSEMVTDINLHSIKKGILFEKMNKNICFDTRYIKNMNFVFGSHKCVPEGYIKYSKRTYLLKHMDMLGLPYQLWKNNERYERNKEMRKQNLNIHYLKDIKDIETKYKMSTNIMKPIQDLFYKGDPNNMTITERDNKMSCRSDISVYILWLHDLSVLRQTIIYYRDLFPNANIILCIEKNTENIEELHFFADFHRCTFLYFENIHKDKNHIKSHCWKSVSNHWVFVVEDDEWLLIRENDLFSEDLYEKTVISSLEYNMVGTGAFADRTGYSRDNQRTRYIGFKRNKIFEMNYTMKDELEDPVGIIQSSEKKYPLKKFLIGLNEDNEDNKENINIVYEPIIIPTTNKYKILVYMADNRSLDESFDRAEYYSLVAGINYAYCLRHGYDFKYVETFYEYKNEAQLHNCPDPLKKEMRHASWSKLLVASSLINKSYDYIVYIDSDCIFHNQFLHLENFIDTNKEKDFIFFNNQPWNPENPSSGFFICHSSDTVKQNLKEWYNVDSQDDQLALWKIQENMNLAILDIPMYFFKGDNQYLCHLASNLKNERLSYFRKIILLKKINYNILINKIWKSHYSNFDTSLV